MKKDDPYPTRVLLLFRNRRIPRALRRTTMVVISNAMDSLMGRPVLIHSHLPCCGSRATRGRVLSFVPEHCWPTCPRIGWWHVRQGGRLSTAAVIDSHPSLPAILSRHHEARTNETDGPASHRQCLKKSAETKKIVPYSVSFKKIAEFGKNRSKFI
jgi:hypothetical protein